MTNLFNKPKQGDKVILTDRNGFEKVKRIYSVTARSIRISGCNVYRFNRNGMLHKNYEHIGLKIRPATHGETE